MSKKTINHAPITNTNEEIHENAKLALLQMKQLEKKYSKKMKTIRLTNNIILSTNSKEILKEYEEKYGKL